MNTQEKQVILFALSVVHSAWAAFSRRLSPVSESDETIHVLFVQIDTGLTELERVMRRDG